MPADFSTKIVLYLYAGTHRISSCNNYSTWSKPTPLGRDRGRTSTVVLKIDSEFSKYEFIVYRHLCHSKEELCVF